MKLDLTPEQAFFHGTTRQFLDDKVPTSLLRELRERPGRLRPRLLAPGRRPGLDVAAGDRGGRRRQRQRPGRVDLALVAFEFGRYAAPGPLTTANVVAAAVARSGTAEQKAELLPGLMTGDRIGSWAYAEPRPFERLGAVGVRARLSDGQYVLTGHKAPVEAAGQADLFLVTAVLATEGDEDRRADSVPGARGHARGVGEPDAHAGHHPALRARRVRRRRGPGLGRAGRGRGGGRRRGRWRADVERQLQIALVIQLAEMTGAMDRGLELTTEWLFNRYSFGRPLASYQALKHRFADMRAWLEAGHAMADAAAQHVQEESGRAGEYVSAGKSFLGVAALEVLQECVQFHGGIGVTFEHDLHLYLRRATVDAQLYGTVADHRERLTAILEAEDG